MHKLYLAAIVALGAATPALATAPIPAPVAGAFGPAGLAVAAVGYLGYRIWKKRSDD